MKIHSIDKKNLLVQSENKITIEITPIGIDDIEDDGLSLILAIGDEDNPASQNIINKVTLNMLYLLSTNPGLSSIPERIVLTLPENVPAYFPNAVRYLMDVTTIDSFMNDLDNDPSQIDENWFFISVGYDMSENDRQEFCKELLSRYPNIRGLVMRHKIAIYYEN